MSKQRSTLIVVFALVVLSVFIAYQQFTNTTLRDEMAVLRAEQARQITQDEATLRKRIEYDANRAMRAVCVLAEYAQSDRDADREEALTIRSAEFELLYFTQQYLTSPSAGKPMLAVLFTGDLALEGWHIHGEYYPSLKAVSISLDAAKGSTMSNITPDGEIRFLLERIHRWMDKYQKSQ